MWVNICLIDIIQTLITQNEVLLNTSSLGFLLINTKNLDYDYNRLSNDKQSALIKKMTIEAYATQIFFLYAC